MSWCLICTIFTETNRCIRSWSPCLDLAHLGLQSTGIQLTRRTWSTIRKLQTTGDGLLVIYNDWLNDAILVRFEPYTARVGLTFSLRPVISYPLISYLMLLLFFFMITAKWWGWNRSKIYLILLPCIIGSVWPRFYVERTLFPSR